MATATLWLGSWLAQSLKHRFFIFMMNCIVSDKLDYPGVNFFPYIAPTEGKRSRMKKPKNSFEITGEDLGSIL